MYKLILVFLQLSIFSCNRPSDFKNDDELRTNIEIIDKQDSSTLITDYSNLKRYAIYGYNPSNLDISKDLNDSLKYFNLEEIFKNSTNSEINYIVNLFLLKGYLFHLKTANQGYDLYNMRKGNTSLIINYFIDQNNIPSSGEYLNSGYVYTVIMEDINEQDSNTIQIMHLIKIELSRIESGEPWRE